ncbi:MAG: ROK family protein [Bacteroidetes bacterium]|nr:ROK family protein [Bacteroidota bacterium]
MYVLAIDIGGTKAAFGLVDHTGTLSLQTEKIFTHSEGTEVNSTIISEILRILHQCAQNNITVNAVSIAIPGIVWPEKGTVWAPNIKGWDDYPLQKEIESAIGKIPVIISNDRTCYIIGEKWKGYAQECSNVIFIAVGTGIGAGIMVNNKVLTGSNDIAGSVGWMALPAPGIINSTEKICAFEHYASGRGMVLLAKNLMTTQPQYKGCLKNKQPLSARDIIEAYTNDELAQQVVQECIELWGLAAANLISIFNPDKVIFGGGVFGPAAQFLPQIKKVITLWAQPKSAKHCIVEVSALRRQAGIFGAACIAFQLPDHQYV